MTTIWRVKLVSNPEKICVVVRYFDNELEAQLYARDHASSKFSTIINAIPLPENAKELVALLESITD